MKLTLHVVPRAMVWDLQSGYHSCALHTTPTDLPIPASAWVERGGLHLWVQDYEIVSFC